MLKNAKERDCGQMNKRSFMKGAGNIIGFLGEEMVKKYSKLFIADESYDHDFLINGKGVDVKTKRQTVSYDPKENYEASVAMTSMHQDTDYYIFCRVFKDESGNFPYGWIIGAISKKDFVKRSTAMTKGQLDKSNGYFVKENCYNITYDKLLPIDDFLKNSCFRS